MEEEGGIEEVTITAVVAATLASPCLMSPLSQLMWETFLMELSKVTWKICLRISK